MMAQVLEVDWKDPEYAIPGFLTIAFMPFAYSISVGIGVGFIAYTVIQITLGKARQIHPLMWLTSILFVVYFLLGPIRAALGAWSLIHLLWGLACVGPHTCIWAYPQKQS